MLLNIWRRENAFNQWQHKDKTSCFAPTFMSLLKNRWHKRRRRLNIADQRYMTSEAELINVSGHQKKKRNVQLTQCMFVSHQSKVQEAEPFVTKNYSDLVGMICIFIYSSSNVRHVTKRSPSVVFCFHSKTCAISWKTKHSQTVLTSANILHTFLICCYGPTAVP